MATLEDLFNGNGRIDELSLEDLGTLTELVAKELVRRATESEKDHSAVLIDGAVPRTPMERCMHLYMEMLTLDGYIVTDVTETLDPGHLWQEMFGDLPRGDSEAEHDQAWNELEDEIVDDINRYLPDGWLCVVGEYNPGDVVIRKEV